MGRVLAFRRPSPAVEDEAALVERCRRGDREALGIVLERYAPQLERLIAKLAGPGPEVEDLLHQSFLAAIEAFPRYRGEARVGTWLSRIAVHVTIDALRKPGRRRVVAADLDAHESRVSSPDDATAARIELARARALLEELTPARRVAFILHALEGRPIEEVAALMGASVVATKSRIFWARRTLFARARRDPVLCARFGGAP